MDGSAQVDQTKDCVLSSMSVKTVHQAAMRELLDAMPKLILYYRLTSTWILASMHIIISVGSKIQWSLDDAASRKYNCMN